MEWREGLVNEEAYNVNQKERGRVRERQERERRIEK